MQEKSRTLKNETAQVMQQPIRFEGKHKTCLWVHPDNILFVKSADHYVKSFVLQDNRPTWAMRHCTIKELLGMLPDSHFIRLNKFYVLNRNHFSHLDERDQVLYLKDGSSIPVTHRISRFIIGAMRS